MGLMVCVYSINTLDCIVYSDVVLNVVWYINVFFYFGCMLINTLRCLDRIVDSFILQSSLEDSVVPSPITPTFFLDIDLCSFYGQDLSDIVTMYQQINDLYRTKQDPANIDSTVTSLIRDLVNPAMVHAIGGLLEDFPEARVCLYTMKPVFWQDHAYPSGFGKGHYEIYIPSGVSIGEYVKIWRAEHPTSTIWGLYRLFKCRDAVQNVLGLSNPPEIIIAAAGKDVKRACSDVLNPPANPDYAFLWDDNNEIKGQFHVITVPQYDAVSREIGAKVQSVLDSVDIDIGKHGKFIENLKPNCNSTGSNKLFVKTTDQALADWPIPEFGQKGLKAETRKRGIDKDDEEASAKRLAGGGFVAHRAGC